MKNGRRATITGGREATTRHTWRESRLSDVATINYGYTQSASGKPIGPRFLRITDIQDDKVDWDTVPYCDIEKDTLAKFQLATGDIVFARTGATTGKSFLVSDPPAAVFASYLIRLRLTDKGLLSEFVSLFFQTNAYWDSIREGSTGSAQGGFNATKLGELRIPIPPLPEQRRIVGILDEAFAGIATAKTHAQQNLQNARAVFESELERVFTKSDATHEMRRLAEVCDEITVGHVGSMAAQYRAAGVPFLRSQNIRPFQVTMENVVFIDDKFHKSLGKSQLRPGDVVIVRTGYPGTAAVIPPTLADANCSDLVIARPSKAIDPYYLAMFFNSSYGKEMVAGRLVGAAQKHFNVTAAKQVTISLPTIKEQRREVEHLDSLRAATDRLAAIYQRKLGALEEFKRSLLAQAFSGEL